MSAIELDRLNAEIAHETAEGARLRAEAARFRAERERLRDAQDDMTWCVAEATTRREVVALLRTEALATLAHLHGDPAYAPVGVSPADIRRWRMVVRRELHRRRHSPEEA